MLQLENQCKKTSVVVATQQHQQQQQQHHHHLHAVGSAAHSRQASALSNTADNGQVSHNQREALGQSSESLRFQASRIAK
jgi:hypothetical protein